MTLQLAFAMYPLCLAGAAVAWILGARSKSSLCWCIDVTAGVSIAAFTYLAGPWAFTSYYLRHAPLVLVVLVGIVSYRHRNSAATGHKGRFAGRLAVSASILVLFTILNASALSSRIGVRESIELPFPLSAGTYYVLQGGNSWVTNPFHALSGSRLALDIARLNGFGNRASGLAPRALDDYGIFRDTVHSPCAGTVVAARSDVPDHPPGEADTERPEGNFVVVRCGDVDILMAHMRQNSIMTATGDVVSLGQPLGQVGNSGNTLEPHLHIEAGKGGEEVGLVFDGRRLTLNSLLIETRRAGQTDAAAGHPQAANH